MIYFSDDGSDYQEFLKTWHGPRLNAFKMTKEERDKIKELNPPEITAIHSTNIYIDWGWKACGFGQLAVSKNEDGSLTCSNEGMSRENVRALLHSYADYLADNIELND